MIFFVSTPIGNLKDITLRAIEVLKSVDVIACEDTRNSLKLLSHYDIHKKLIAYHKFNENASASGIVKLAKEGKNIAIICDSGTPLVSDPGEVLINLLKAENLEYTVVPGASATLASLVLSGFGGGAFAFVGFLNEQNKKREQQLENVKNFSGAIIFYISPHKLYEDCEYIHSILGEQKACLLNEITKMYEKKIFFTLGEKLDIEPLGEYVLVVYNQSYFKPKEDIKVQLKNAILSGIEKNEAIKMVAKQNGIKKSDVYKIALDLNIK